MKMNSFKPVVALLGVLTASVLLVACAPQPPAPVPPAGPHYMAKAMNTHTNAVYMGSGPSRKAASRMAVAKCHGDHHPKSCVLKKVKFVAADKAPASTPAH